MIELNKKKIELRPRRRKRKLLKIRKIKKIKMPPKKPNKDEYDHDTRTSCHVHVTKLLDI
jgi:hypothetical protein